MHVYVHCVGVIFMKKNLYFTSHIGGLHLTTSKYDYANYDQFSSNFDKTHKTIQYV